ncbi:MAG TPA: DUF6179 domain-containing protein [Coriobacteriia bacterium]|nr:DUF6179 domain-containing protein [Coriobacteriia bacterium]
MGGFKLAGRVEGPIPDDRGLLAPLHADAGELASPDELVDFQVRFIRLIERRTAIYTMGDSTSVPMYVAADLVRSICFVLGIDPDDPVITRRLLTVDLEDEYRRRLDEIGRKVEAAKQLLREVDATMPLIENIALRDTLKELGSFFRNYDYRSMAHDIPCSIDYPLCHPVPEDLPGIDYIAEYVRRLMVEARFLGHFDIKVIERVLAEASPDHIELLVNFYEPVAANTLGRALIGKDPAVLVVSGADRAEIAQRLGAVGEAGREKLLVQAAEDACDAFGIADEPSRDYLRELVPDLLPRIAVGLKHDSLGGVFVG